MDLLRRVAPGLSDEGSKDDHLVVVVVRGGWGEGGSVQGQLGTQGEGTFYSCQGPSGDRADHYFCYGRQEQTAGLQVAAMIDPQWPPDVAAQFSQLNLQWITADNLQQYHFTPLCKNNNVP
jgi:hypothetical protein